MREFVILDTADQQFGTILNDQRTTIRLRYSAVTDRWSFDLSLDDLPVIQGKRIVTGVDLLASFKLGIGMLFALPSDPTTDAQPDRYNLPAGVVRLYTATDGEYAEAVT